MYSSHLVGLAGLLLAFTTGNSYAESIALITHCDNDSSFSDNHSDGLPAICQTEEGAAGDPAGFTKQNGMASASAGGKRVGVTSTSDAETVFNNSNGDNIESIMFTDSFARAADFVRLDAKDAQGRKIPKGLMTVNFRLSGELTVSGIGDFRNSFAELTYIVEVDGEKLADAKPKLISTLAVPLPQPTKLDVVLFQKQVSWDGESLMNFSVQARGRANAVARGAGSKAHAEVNFGHTLYWGGITEVTDEFSNPVASFTALGEDGTDWATAAVVPIPAAVWLFGGALGCLGALRRKAGNTPSPHFSRPRSLRV